MRAPGAGACAGPDMVAASREMAAGAPTYDLVLLLDTQAEDDARAKIVADARAAIRDLVQSCATLLVIPDYERDVDSICPRCEETGTWRLASGQDVMDILGYV